jgi:galactokinase
MRDEAPTVDVIAQSLADKFVRLFGGVPHTYQAPGRVNLIGEHTDYNDGFVMPAAVGFYTWVALSPRNDRKLVVRSENFDEQIDLSLDKIPSKGRNHWSDYVVGVAKMLEDSGFRLSGANLLLEGNVPQGAGLSSSASLEVAVGYALLSLGQRQVDRTTLALICRRAENEFVGAQVGIMDQFVSSHGKSGRALLLDCRSLEYRLLPLPDHARLVICNTMVRHSLANGEYNQRRAECEAGLQILAKHLPGVHALRDVTLSDLSAYRQYLPPTILRRCHHVISENARVIEAAASLENGNLENFGRLMGQSHQSLRDDYEVSCPELDLMVELSNQIEGVYGSRMTGGGFGGCTVNLVREDRAKHFAAAVSLGYEKATGSKPQIYTCFAADGASQVHTTGIGL